MNLRHSIPNLLTYSRIILIPVIVITFSLPSIWSYWLTSGLFLYASVTDWLDGYLARYWKVTSRLGQFLDPIADKLLVATCLLLLVHQDRADILPAIAILCREILVSGLREFLAELHVNVPVTRIAKYKTGVQLGAIYLLLLGPGAPHWLPAMFVGQLGLWFAALLTLVTGYVYLRNGLKHF